MPNFFYANEHRWIRSCYPVTGPIEFCIYTIPLSAVLNHYNIDYHIYADDTQIYCKFNLKSADEELKLITTYIVDVRSWMIKNKLKLNDDKTEFLVISSPSYYFK